MKSRFFIISIILFAIIFAVSNIVTYQHESPFDGSDYTGWPFRYYEYFGPESSISPAGRYFMPLFLIIDIVIILFVSMVISYLISRFTSKDN